MRYAAFFLATLLPACVPLPVVVAPPGAENAPVPPDPARVAICRAWRADHGIWGGVALASGVIVGASGLATLPIEDRAGRIAIGSASLAVGTLGAVAGYAVQLIGANYAAEGCAELLGR